MITNPRGFTTGLALVALLALPAHADDKTIARQAFHEGTRHFEMGDFRSALDAFKRAYLSYEEPAFLFNIAQCQRNLGDKSDALRSYRMFLRKLPSSPQRASVERVVAELQAALDAQNTMTTTTPTTTAPPPPALAGPPPPPPAQPLVAAARPAPLLIVAPVAAPRHAPLYQKAWLWGIVGVVAVGVAVGVGVGVGLKPAGNNTTLPNIGPGAAALVQP